MRIESLNLDDLPALKSLQPPDWSDIIPDIRYYINANFCHPIKIIYDNQLAGTGAAIIYGYTAWLAHIIVHPHYRNKGIGFAIVNKLLEITDRLNVQSWLLTATAMGKPVYLKAGFRSVSEYVFLNRSENWLDNPVSDNIVPFSKKYSNQLLLLDAQTSGENRTLLLNDFMTTSVLFVHKGKMQGFYMPNLKEGPIFAENKEAGLELMKIKFKNTDKAVFPEENTTALAFLLKNGFVKAETKGTRMIKGHDIPWMPANIYSRAGGNFG